MTVFDEIPRSALRPKYDSESDFEYHNIARREEPGYLIVQALVVVERLVCRGGRR